jgi:hypothetical protein
MSGVAAEIIDITPTAAVAQARRSGDRKRRRSTESR